MTRLVKLSRRDYQRPAEELAERLIGTILLRRVGRQDRAARVVETEAYLGPTDLASHASKGRTKRTEVMFGPAGHAYVYLIYGMYDMLNVVAGPAGSAHAVLLRAAEAMDGWEADLSGPGKLARALQISRRDNGLDLTGDRLSFWRLAGSRPRIVKTRRVGIDYAGDWVHAPLRFCDADSLELSKPPRGFLPSRK